MFTHNLDPVLFNFGFVSIRWYSLAYIIGILVGWILTKKIFIDEDELKNNTAVIKHLNDGHKNQQTVSLKELYSFYKTI